MFDHLTNPEEKQIKRRALNVRSISKRNSIGELTRDDEDDGHGKYIIARRVNGQLVEAQFKRGIQSGHNPGITAEGRYIHYNSFMLSVQSLVSINGHEGLCIVGNVFKLVKSNLIGHIKADHIQNKIGKNKERMGKIGPVDSDRDSNVWFYMVRLLI